MRDAAVMLLIKDGLILGVSRKDDSTKWGLPGGKKEFNETPEQAAIRETLEETGLKILSCHFIFNRIEPSTTDDGIPFNTHCFYADSWEGEIRNSEEGQVKWLKPSVLSSHTSGAFPEYNLITLMKFKKAYPKIILNECGLCFPNYSTYEE